MIVMSLWVLFFLGGFGGWLFERFVARKKHPRDSILSILSGGGNPPFLLLYAVGAVLIVLADAGLEMLFGPLSIWWRVLIITVGATAGEALFGYASKALTGRYTWDYRKGPGHVSKLTACNGLICVEATAVWAVLVLAVLLVFR